MATVFPIPEHDREELARCGVTSPGCGPGWWPLIALLIDDIRALNAAASAASAEAPRGQALLRVTHLGEKYGTLRFYVNSERNARLNEAIEAAELVSGSVCESCGQPGRERVVGDPSGGWVATACDACAHDPTRRRRSSATDNPAAGAPPIFQPTDPRWWAGESLWSTLAFAAQSQDADTRARALGRMVWLRTVKQATAPDDWEAQSRLDEWALAITDAGTTVPTPAYPEPLQTMVSVLTTGQQPDGTPPTPDQISLLLRHPAASVRVAAQMALAPRRPTDGSRRAR